jgi:hypothetical protein
MFRPNILATIGCRLSWEDNYTSESIDVEISSSGVVKRLWLLHCVGYIIVYKTI